MLPFDILLAGTTQGCIYGLIALGFVMIYKATEMVNFAQADLGILAVFILIHCTTSTDMPFWLSLILTLAFMTLFGFWLDRFLIRQLIGYPPFAVIIMTISLGFVLRSIIGAVWGYNPRGLSTPFQGHTAVFGQTIATEQIVLILTTVFLCLGLAMFFRINKWGIAMRAASENQLAAYYAGIPVQTLYSTAWAMAAFLAAVAGILLGSSAMVDPHSGFIGLKAFAGAVIGGLGSLPGAMLGGLLVGMSEQVAAAYLPLGSQEIVAYVLMLLVLVARPHGVFSQIQRKKV